MSHEARAFPWEEVSLPGLAFPEFRLTVTEGATNQALEELDKLAPQPTPLQDKDPP